jgi:cytochrome P450
MATATYTSMEERARAAGCPILDFDIEDGKDFREDAFGMFDKAREAAPIIYSTAARGFWVFSHSAVLEEAIKNPEVFSNSVMEVHRTEDHVFPVLIPESLDPPVHHKYRTALAPMFSPRAVAKFEHLFRDRALKYIDQVVGRTEIDFMAVIGRPLPADFFLALIDVPEALHTSLTDALITTTFTTPSDDPTGAIRMQASQLVVDAIHELVATKQKNPGEDVFSQILEREVDGRKLNDEELYSIALLLANAGVETTGGSLGYIFEFLAHSEGHRRHLVASLDNTVPAIEELLRRFPVANSSRLVMKDLEFHGIDLRAGDRVIINRIAANRDPSLIENGGEVILDRKFNNHTTFGDGIHACLGSHVARREIRIVLEEWHKRFPEYRLAPGYKAHHHVGTTISLSELPLVLG